MSAPAHVSARGPAVHRGIGRQVVDRQLLVEVNLGLYVHRHRHACVQFLTIFALEIDVPILAQ